MNEEEVGVSEASWQGLYQAQISRYEAAFDADHNMDAKGGVILTAILAVAVFVLNKQLFLVDNKWLFALLILGCVIYIVAVGLLLYALHPKPYSLPANTTKDRPDYLTKQNDELMYQLIVDVEYAADAIIVLLGKKAKLFTISTSLFVTGTIMLLVVKLIAG